MPDKPTHLEIKGWRDFQHYREDRPAWIKLYGRLLDDPDFLSLPDLAQLQLIKLWLLASRMGHPLVNDPKLLAGKIGCRGKFYLTALVDAGFLNPAYKNSIESIEQIEPELRVLSTEDREQRTETTPPSATAREELLSLVPNRRAWELEFDAAKQGMHGPTATDAQIEEACREYLGNGAAKNPNMPHWRGHLKRVVQPPEPRPSTRPTNDLEAGQEFERVRDIVNMGDLRNLDASKLTALPQRTRAALRAIGGHVAVKECKADRLTWLKKDFIAAYLAAGESAA